MRHGFGTAFFTLPSLQEDRRVHVVMHYGSNRRITMTTLQTESDAQEYIADIYRQGYIVVRSSDGYETVPASRVRFEVINV